MVIGASFQTGNSKKALLAPSERVLERGRGVPGLDAAIGHLPSAPWAQQIVRSQTWFPEKCSCHRATWRPEDAFDLELRPFLSFQRLRSVISVC